jgi:hypothetical protein
VTSLSIDFETRSTVNLPKAGVYVYAADPTTDIWCMAWAFDDEEPEIWTPGSPLPAARAHVEHIARWRRDPRVERAVRAHRSGARSW